MVTKEELIGWLQTLPPDQSVWIDKGGLNLVAGDGDNAPYLGVGGNSNCEQIELVYNIADDAEDEGTPAPAREVHDYGWNEEHPEHSRGDWVDEVTNGDTYLGYNDWVYHRIGWDLHYEKDLA